MKVSIIIAVLNSHEIFRRQLLYFKNMNLPDDVELIYIDDGSDPPLTAHPPGATEEMRINNLTIHPTRDYRPWTVALARNMGARIAKGKYVLMTDIDYIIPWEAIDHVRHFDGDKVRFERRFGILDEDGYLVTDLKVLAEYGLLQERIEKKGNYMPPHPNNFAMRREIFWMLGGYDENKMELSYPKCTDDGAFKGRWAAARDKGLVKDSDTRPILYMFPSGQFCSKTDVDYNPFGFFHNLTRKTDTNIYHRKAKRRENLPN